MLQLSFVDFKKGTYLLVDGTENNDRFYIIQSGKVSCSNSQLHGKKKNKVLVTGDFVGVIPCMSGRPQIEDAVAITDVRCIAVNKEQYADLISNNTPVALKIIKTFASRMREMNDQLTRMTLRSVSSESPEHIYEVAKFYDSINKIDIATYAYYQYMQHCINGKHVEKAMERYNELEGKTRAVYLNGSPELTRTYPQGTMIFSESQTGEDMFVIQSGKVSITKVVDGNEVTLAVLQHGDMVGEMALLENKPRSANAIAHEECMVMVVNKNNFNQMVSSQPQLIARLTTTFAERLWSMYRQLDNASLKEPLHKCIDMIALQAEKQRITSGIFNTDLSPKDIVNMCGIPHEKQEEAMQAIQKESIIKIQNGRIYVAEAKDLLNLANLFKQQEKGK